MISDKAKAIISLRPNAEWVLKNNSIEWLDTQQKKPTEDEINIEIARLKAEYAAHEYQRQRAAEYPDFKDYLDGIVKGDQAQIQAYIDACNAVKAKYPKGQ